LGPNSGTVEKLNEPVATRRVRFVVAYNGSGLHGFAINDHLPTVSGLLIDALTKITRAEINLVGAGRTDAGVHAWGQVVSCDIPAHLDLNNVAHRANRMCGPHVVIREASWMPETFSARFSAVWREYRYTVWNYSVPSPFLHSTSWHVHRPLSLPAMRLACDAIIGERDFTSFCRKPDQVVGKAEPSLKRNVMFARWSDITESIATADQSGSVLQFDIRANAFCHQMVRSIVGTMINVGDGSIRAADVGAIMRARNRQVTGSLAPPHGLTLWEVGYPAGIDIPSNSEGTSSLRPI
jgi:tRNA pseudouridine38-40 synthase